MLVSYEVQWNFIILIIFSYDLYYRIPYQPYPRDNFMDMWPLKIPTFPAGLFWHVDKLLESSGRMAPLFKQQKKGNFATLFFFIVIFT